MLVYGDRKELIDPRQRARDINRRIDDIDPMSAGLTRHAQLVAVLIDTGQLLQGVGDAAFSEGQRDRRTAVADELGGVLLRLARQVCRSWNDRNCEISQLPRLSVERDWPQQVEQRVPEGFAFYAVYPGAYIEAARRLELVAAPRVIGIRSIGTSLGAAVAAALDAPPPVTVRPFGDPSARKIAVDPALERDLLEGKPHYVIVDEGPGQSGSSFGAVADWLADRGVPIERIALVPSHAGMPGGAAADRRRVWWRRVQRPAGDFGSSWPRLIQRWCGGILGALDAPPEEISGGAWRGLQSADEHAWPATVPAWERRKFLVRANGQSLLVKFAGLGRIGEAKVAIARSLHSDGLVPEPVGIAHGFLIERWCDGTPLARGENPVAEIARYIGTRARLLPASSGSGAAADELLAMMRRNVAVEFGDDAARALDSWTERANEIGRCILRVRTDNKLDRHEWLRTTSGALIKCDALDHHQAHDLVGCQDVAWDCAGALIEFDLGQKEAAQLIAWVEHWANQRVDRDLLHFYRIAYLAFRLGQSRLGSAITEAAAERQRLTKRGDRYAFELQNLLESSRAATRLGSSLG